MAQSKKRSIISRFAFLVFCVIAASTITVIFYTSPVRNAVENVFYDMRTLIKPPMTAVDSIRVVAIDQVSIRFFEDERQADLSLQSLIRIIKKLQTTQAQLIVVVLYPHIHSFTDPDLANLAQMSANDGRIVFGTLGLNTMSPSAVNIPETLQPVSENVWGMESFRSRSREIVRQLPFVSYRGRTKTGMLAPFAGGLYDARSNFDGLPTFYKLNYINPARIPTISAKGLFKSSKPLHQKDPSASPRDDSFERASKDLPNTHRHSTRSEESRKMTSASPQNDRFSNRIVFIGYTAYRHRPIFTDSTHVNSPWQEDGAEVKRGVPYIYVQANAAHNILTNSWLRTSATWVTIVQTIIFSLYALLIWRAGTIFAVAMFFIGWLLLLYSHGYLMTHFALLIPLADTFLWSSFATVAGGLWRLRLEGQQRARQVASLEAQKDIDRTQSHFLDQFGDELSLLNMQILGQLQQNKSDYLGLTAIKPLYQRLLVSTEEFQDYLSGIKQISNIEVQKQRSLEPKNIDIDRMLKRIIRQFDSRIDEKNLTIKTQLSEDKTIKTDPHFLEPVLFNFISNAIKYSPSNASIIIALDASKKTYQFSVQDFGPGIASEDQDKIFEKFYRIKNEHTYKIKGNGLGLYLCRFFAERLGGQVWVKSTPGKGATFYLGIPHVG